MKEKTNYEKINQEIIEKIQSVEWGSPLCVKYQTELLEKNIGLINDMIRNMSNCLCVGFEQQDAFQVCSITLCESARTYNKELGSFANYVCMLMRQRILKEYFSNCHKLSVPRYIAPHLKYEFVDIEDIAETDASDEDEEELLYSDIIKDDNREVGYDVEYEDMHEKILKAMSDEKYPLSAREAKVLIMYFGLDGKGGSTQTDIAKFITPSTKRMNHNETVTVSRIGQILNRALRKMRLSSKRQHSGLKDYLWQSTKATDYSEDKVADYMKLLKEKETEETEYFNRTGKAKRVLLKI